jgi:Phage integrase family
VAGRPSLRIGQHGKITRRYLGGGLWLAQCRFRDSDGVTRRVQRLGPPDEHDKYGKLATDALIEALAERRPPSGSDTIGLETLVMTLVDQHIVRLAEDGRSARTLDTYRYDASKLAKFMGGVKVGESSAKAKGLVRADETKTAAGRRVIPLPAFAIAVLSERRNLPFLGQQLVIFPSTNGTLRDPDNFAGQWRKTRDELGVPDISSHSFRKTVATLIDDAGLSARIGADHLGHAKVSMTQDRYMSRGRVHNQVAELLDRAVNDDSGPT